MALIKCPECGKQISDKAATCPNCGIDVQKATVPQHRYQPDTTIPEPAIETRSALPASTQLAKTGSERPEKKKIVAPWIVAGAACLAAIVMVGLQGKSCNDMDLLVSLNDGFQLTNISLANQINDTYQAFADQASKEPEKAGPYYEKALAVKAEADDLINYVEALKWDLVKKVECDKAKTPKEAVAMALERGLLKSTDTLRHGRGCYEINTSKVKSKGNINKPTTYMMSKTFELSEKIRKYRAEIFKAVGEEHIHEQGLMTDSIFSSNREDLGTDAVKEYYVKVGTTMIKYYGAKIDYAPGATNPLNKSWGYHNFHHTVLVADVALLNKLISEAQTAELNAVNQLMTNIHVAYSTYYVR